MLLGPEIQEFKTSALYQTRLEVQYIALLVEKSSTSTATVQVHTPQSHNVRRFFNTSWRVQKMAKTYPKFLNPCQKLLASAKNFLLVLLFTV